MTNVAEMTAAEVDAVLAENYAARAKAQASIGNWERYANGRTVRNYERERAATEIATLRERIEELHAAAAPFQARYDAERWNRYFLVTNGNGHVHRGMDCGTCYATTQYAWLVDLADCDEAAMVAEYGEVACSVCFPDAPSAYAAMKAAGLLTANERRTQAEVEARRAEKQAKAAAKAEKAITNPDGTPLRTRGWGRVATLVTAQRELTNGLVQVMVLREDRRERGADQLSGLIAEYQGDVDQLAAAIAAKQGRPVEDVLAEGTAKAEKKFRRDYR